MFAQSGSEYEQGRLLDDIKNSSFVVAHHAKFELGWLNRCGAELRDIIVWCTQIAEYVQAGNRKLRGGLGLDATLKRYGLGNKMRYVRALIEAGVCPSEIAPLDLGKYCFVDVDRTYDLFIRQRSEMAVRQTALQYGRCLQAPMLADTETRGVQLDQARVRSTAESTFKQYNGLVDELQDSFGTVNWNSPKQIGELVYGKLGFSELKDHRRQPVRTSSGKPSTSEETLASLRGHTEDQREFQRIYGELAPLKKQVQILEKMLGACEEDNGLIYATFNQTVTQTHRLSSSGGRWGFQFQNIARALRSLFRAREKGWVVIDGDCPQLEFRAATDMAHDPVALADILGRIDVHKFTASIIGCSRQDAKPHTFKPLYGGRSGTKRERAYYDAFRARYAVIYNTQMSWVYHVLEHKSLTIPSGLTFYWPDTAVTGSGYITNTPSIFNYPIQSFATADISQLSLLLVWHAIRGLHSFICNTVHDSGVLEAPLEEVDKIKEIMVHCYTEQIYECLDRLYGYRFNTPLGLGIKTGEYWGEAANEEKFENTRRFKWAA